jgi:4-hydroxy-2-oxoheptanedioate aldolase
VTALLKSEVFMNETNNRFKNRILSGPVALGTWLMSTSENTAEALSYTGFDFLVVDMEHVPIEISDLPRLLRAVECGQANAVVRLAWNDRVLVKRALDAGAKTIMLPFIETVEDAEAAVSYTRYPLAGTRGVAGVHRGSRFGYVPDYLKVADQEICTIVQLETPAALARLEDIGAVAGVDALFIGPNDLAAAMGHIGNIGHAEVQALIADAARRAKLVGKPIGILGPNLEMLRGLIELGFDFAAVSSDLVMMMHRARECLGALRRH